MELDDLLSRKVAVLDTRDVSGCQFRLEFMRSVWIINIYVHKETSLFPRTFCLQSSLLHISRPCSSKISINLNEKKKK